MTINKISINIFIVLCLFFFPISTQAESINLEKVNFELGMQSLKQKDYSQAIKYFKLVLDKNPYNVEAHYNLSVAYKKNGNDRASVNQLEKVVQLLNSPEVNTPEPINIYRASSSDSGVSNAISSDFGAYRDIKSKENDYIDLADMHMDSGEYAVAVEYYNLALQINPYNDITYFKISKCYINLENFIQAEPYIEKAIEFNPNNPRYKYYQELIADNIDEKYMDNLKLREQLVINTNNSGEALKEFEKQYKRELVADKWIDEDDNKFNNKGLFEEVNIKEPAHKDIEPKTAEQVNDSFNSRRKTKDLYELSNDGYGDFAYKQSQELDYIDLGDLHFDNMDFNSAIEYYNLSLQINPNNDYVYYKLSRSYIELGNYKKANEFIDKALTLTNSDKKYVYFKNEINEKLAEGDTAQHNYYSAYKQPQKYTPEYKPYQASGSEIAVEPHNYPTKREKSVIEKLTPDKDDLINVVKLPKKGFDAIKDKLADEPDKKEERPEQANGSVQYSVFNRDIEYYQVDEEQFEPEDKIVSKSQDEPLNPEAQKTHLSAEYFNERGVDFFNQENLIKAENYFKKAIQLKPMYSKAYNNLASIEYKRGNLDKAEMLALKSVEINPVLPEGYYNLSIISKAKRDTVNELVYLNKTVEADPKYYEGYYSRAIYYYNKGDYVKAKSNFQEVLALKNDHYLASQNLGVIYANELNNKQAESYLTHAVKLNKNSARSYYYLAVVNQASGNIVDSIENFRRAIELNPVDYKSYLALSKSYVKNSQPEKALQTLKEAIVKNPSNAELYNSYGLVSLRFDRYDEAVESFEKSVEIDPKRPIYHYNLSQGYICLNKRKDAKREFESAVNIVPTSIQDYIDISEIFYDRGMISYAVQILREGITNIPNNDYLYLVLSDFYERTGAKTSAKTVLNEYLTANPDGTLSILVKRRLSSLGL